MDQKYVVFISLILDLLAFTLILPLFPKIFEFYHSNANVSKPTKPTPPRTLNPNTFLYVSRMPPTTSSTTTSTSSGCSLPRLTTRASTRSCSAA